MCDDGAHRRGAPRTTRSIGSQRRAPAIPIPPELQVGGMPTQRWRITDDGRRGWASRLPRPPGRHEAPADHPGPLRDGPHASPRRRIPQVVTARRAITAPGAHAPDHEVSASVDAQSQRMLSRSIGRLTAVRAAVREPSRTKSRPAASSVSQSARLARGPASAPTRGAAHAAMGCQLALDAASSDPQSSRSCRLPARRLHCGLQGPARDRGAAYRGMKLLVEGSVRVRP